MPEILTLIHRRIALIYTAAELLLTLTNPLPGVFRLTRKGRSILLIFLGAPACDIVVQGFRTDHLATLKFSRNQCPAKAGIERPVMFLKSLLHIVEECSLCYGVAFATTVFAMRLRCFARLLRDSVPPCRYSKEPCHASPRCVPY